jgi:nucleotide-binding universal stress UspA family protein
MSLQSLKKVIWAIDAFDSNRELYKNSAHFIRQLVQMTGCVIQPVYILSESDLMYKKSDLFDFGSDYQTAAKNSLKELLSSLEIEELTEPTVLVQRAYRSDSDAELLSNFAFAVEADSICVCSHGKKGLERMFLGSFAETLLLKSKVPIIVIPSHLKKDIHLNQFIFPTDLKSESRTAFRSVVRMAKAFQAKLSLFHSVAHPIDSLLQSGVYLLGGGTWVPAHSYFGKNIDQQTRLAEAWASWANHQGVETDFVVDPTGGSVQKALIALTQMKDAGFIVMEGISGPVESVMIGSVARQVIRASDRPVWIIRSSMLRHKRNFPSQEHKEAA